MYWVIVIFGIILLVSYDCIVSVIDNEFFSMDWYLDNDYEVVVLVFFSYIVSYCMFSYVVFKFD